jgi:hypothetical protein
LSVIRERDGVVTVVSGLPRSGTSMMMRMLEKGGMAALVDDHRPADEDNPNGYYELKAVFDTAKDASWLEAAEGKCVKMVYALLPDLPFDFDYKVLFLRRPLEEVVASQDVMLRRRGAPESREGATDFASDLRRVEAWLKEEPYITTLDVEYHEVLREPLVVAKRVADFLGGGLDIHAMAGAVDPALYRQRRRT